MERSRNDILKEERRQQIVDVSLELFSKNGYHGVSVSMIAKTCGISKGLMYNYFDSKEALLVAILEDYTKSIYKELDLNKDGVLTKDEFEHFIRTIYRLVKENPKYYKLIFALSFQESIVSKLHEITSALLPMNIELLQAYFTSLGREDVGAELMMFTSTLKGFLLQLVFVPDFESLMPEYVKQFDKMVDLIIEQYT